MEDILDLYEETKVKELATIFVKYADSTLTKRESILQQSNGACRYSNFYQSAPIWAVRIEANKTNESKRKGNCWTVSSVHTGMILRPLARFVRIVESDEQLKKIYGVYATKYEKAIYEALEYHEKVEQSTCIYQYSGDGLVYGYSKFCLGCDQTETQPERSGIMAPLNFLAVIGSVYAELSYRSPYYYDRATYFARTVKDLIGKTVGPRGTWAYWPAYNRNNIDDTSHGALVADFVARAKQFYIVFTEQDLRDVISNFIENTVIQVQGKKHLATDIDGAVYQDKNGKNIYYDNSCGMWLKLGDFDTRVTQVCKQVCDWDTSSLSCRSDKHSYLRAEAQIFRLMKAK